MQSKKSCFNRAAFTKNLTRFAPVLALYTLLLLLFLLMMWKQAGDIFPEYYFLYQISDFVKWTAVINLGYACLMAQLLFGDLYNTRMCNALHALPLRRETWFLTNVASGLVYSLIPTAIAALVLIPMLMGTVFVGAWKIALWYFLITNVEFICLFGIAVFCALVVGSRFTMVAGYGLVNFGSGILYWLVNTVYTPMLYGMVTPSALAGKLVPMQYMLSINLEVEEAARRALFDEVGRLIPGANSPYMITGLDCLGMLALVGVVFAVLGLILYHFRNLECAGDAVCSRKLVPVFQILSALFVAVAAEYAASEFMGYGNSLDWLKFLFLFCGLIVGWFAGKMLVERSARVFRPQNWVGLGILAAVLAASMGLTKLDVLHLEERMPEIGDIASVQLNFYKMEDRSDIETVLKLHNLALNDRVNQDGAYALEENGEYVRMEDSFYRYWQEGDPLPQQRIADNCYLTYTLKDGRTVRRSYNVWVDSAAGEIPQKLLSRWDAVNSETVRINDKDVEVLPLVLDSMERMYCSLKDGKLPEKLQTRAAAESLIRAIKADCAAGTMAQNEAYHEGVFAVPQSDGDTYETRSLFISLASKNYSWDVNVFADCENTIRWMRDNGLLSEDVTILPKGTSPRYY
ncbi:MAG: hypothetical protein MSS60_10580 [Clostridiales bacterium]|nr:hypothetical protein [Clostridiales bacterium]